MARTLHRAEPVHNELKRLAEARNQTYEMSALLAEFIDNSNSARRTPDQLVQVNLRVYKDDETDQLVLSVTDNASGIPDTSLGLIIGRGNSIGGGVNNEHGVGLKNAALNGSQYLRNQGWYVLEELRHTLGNRSPIGTCFVEPGILLQRLVRTASYLR